MSKKFTGEMQSTTCGIINGLSTVVLRTKDYNGLLALQNTVRRMILGLWPRRKKRTEELKAEIMMNNLGAKTQHIRMNFKGALKSDLESLTLSFIELQRD